MWTFYRVSIPLYCVFPITICNILAFNYEFKASSKVFIVREREREKYRSSASVFRATSEPRAFYLFKFKNWSFQLPRLCNYIIGCSVRILFYNFVDIIIITYLIISFIKLSNLIFWITVKNQRNIIEIIM